MPTLHKFKLLATQCAVAGSPTRSPTTSPVIHLRRRRTLRMFLSRPSDHRHRIHDPPHEIPRNDAVRVRHKLKDLFVSSPPPPPLQDDDNNSCRQQQQQQQRHQEEHEGLLPGSAVGASFRRGGNAALRPASSAFRYRLLRRAWRPMLLTIPE